MSRFTQLALALLVGALLVPPVGADHPSGEDEPFYHITLDVRDLEPGANHTHHLLSPEGPLRQGWIYILYGGVVGNSTIEVLLNHDNRTMDRFVWTPGAFHKNSTKIRATGAHDLILTNIGNETVRYAFYYDQSCNCVGKAIPLQGGFVLFNNQFEQGRTVDYDLYVYEPTITLRGALATYDSTLETARWPEDFDIIDQKTVRGQDWLNFTFTPAERRTYYVFYEALAGATPDDPVQLTPIIEVEKQESEKAPGTTFMFAVLAVALALVLRRP